MKNAVVAKGPKVTINDVPVPKPKAGQVLIKVVYSGSNPKDWKLPEYREPHNSGDDIAGIVEAVGDDVIEFHKGDRVAAFHEMMEPSGSFAEYAIAEDYTTFHLPKKTSFEEGASIPLAAMTAAVGLYQRLGLPDPWKPTTTPTPLIVYGASGAVGAYAIKLAQLSNIHPIIAIAGRAQDFVEQLITREKGDTIIDYRKGDEAIVSGIKDALTKAGAREVKYAFDAVSEHNSFQNISQVLAKQGSKITLVLPGRDYSAIPDYIEKSTTNVGSVHMAPSEEQAKLGIKTGGGLVYCSPT
ncbi:uncharacterized protein L3040_003408 [Drepanopeziza brunnea f. sp. 'multigermtubi']|uniref:uncharacterized protein n=1 Tax=Drepanopeziza brunnea f. sp. 'multigermtubi' TaxID=698441 RepID=UPI00239AC3BE|nr:hypothetical protein L3040_003408 [Drepanopeziza brunnea f. sp. 'multigermtubi']